MINRYHRILHYSLALVTVIFAYFVRKGLSQLGGGELPTYITFYPAVMAVALLGGIGPGLAATAFTAMLTDYCILPPTGNFSIASLSDAIGLCLFSCMGVFMSVVAEMYRRNRDRLEELVDKRTSELVRSNEQLQREVMERRHAEEALRESEDRFRTLADNIPQLCWIANSEGWIFWYNKRWYEYTGTTSEQMEGWGWQSVHNPEILPQVLERWTESIATGKPFDMVFPLLGSDGIFRPFLTRVMPVFDQEGKVVRWFGTNTDITERKRAEQAIETSLHEKEVLLKEIHHRVKNNMQVISSLVSLQADGSNNETVREVLKDVSYRVRSMALVHEKLYQSANLAHIDFAEYTQSLLNYLWRSHGSAAATVRLTFDLDPVSLPVDTAIPCGLILNELAGNALKHAFRGRDEGEVHVSLKKIDDGHFRLSVADDGIGLPKDLDWRHTGSLGLRLVQMLAWQLDASLDTCGSAGTCFEIIIQDEEEKQT